MSQLTLFVILVVSTTILLSCASEKIPDAGLAVDEPVRGTSDKHKNQQEEEGSGGLLFDDNEPEDTTPDIWGEIPAAEKDRTTLETNGDPKYEFEESPEWGKISSEEDSDEHVFPHLKELCSHTRGETYPWWRVDLDQESLVTSIVIINRAQGLHERLRNIQVSVGYNDIKNSPPNTQFKENAICRYFSGTLPPGETEFKCMNPLVGRFVTIQSIPNCPSCLYGQSSVLTLCEVEVYGKNAQEMDYIPTLLDVNNMDRSNNVESPECIPIIRRPICEDIEVNAIGEIGFYALPFPDHFRSVSKVRISLGSNQEKDRKYNFEIRVMKSTPIEAYQTITEEILMSESQSCAKWRNKPLPEKVMQFECDLQGTELVVILQTVCDECEVIENQELPIVQLCALQVDSASEVIEHGMIENENGTTNQVPQSGEHLTLKAPQYFVLEWYDPCTPETDENLSLGKSTKQSSTDWKGLSKLAVDGIVSTQYFAGTRALECPPESNEELEEPSIHLLGKSSEERSNKEHTSVSCYQLKFKNGGLGDTGVRDPLGSPLQAFCDVKTPPGDWMIILKRHYYLSERQSFDQDYVSYKYGFGDLCKEYWLGLENIHKLTHLGHYILRIDLVDSYGNNFYAQYSNFTLDGEDQQYELHLGWFSGTARNLLHSGMKFNGQWWVDSEESSYDANLNGKLWIGRSEDGILFWGRDQAHGRANYYIQFAEMKVREV